jgi:TIR domain
MSHQLFLSHDSRDRVKADVIANAIGRMTLGQIAVWHSSDTAPDGGLRPGHVWLDEIRSRLASSKAIVALITPASVSRPWLMFESGFGAAQPACDVIPVCVGIDSASGIPFPLAMYQSYLLSDYDSLKRFAQKLLSNYGIRFDEEMAKPVLLNAVKQLSQAEESESAQQSKSKEPSVAQAISELKEHIDKRFVSLISSDSGAGATPAVAPRYNIAIDLNLTSQATSTQFIEITGEASVQEILDRVYFMLDGEVGAWKYLVQWVLRDLSTTEHLIVREVQYRIPAQAVFTPSSKWEVVRLSKPYMATDDLSSLRGNPRKTAQ